MCYDQNGSDSPRTQDVEPTKDARVQDHCRHQNLAQYLSSIPIIRLDSYTMPKNSVLRICAFFTVALYMFHET